MARAVSRVAVVGAGWAGLAAAVEATRRGHAVTLLEAAARPGGRARRQDAGPQRPGLALDNGQHLLIGACQATLELMAAVGLRPEDGLRRHGLCWLDPQGEGFEVPAGAGRLRLLAGLLGARGWRLRDRLGLLAWMLARLARPPAAGTTVAAEARRLAERPRRAWVDALCLAALNTEPGQADARLFRRLMLDGLMGGPGARDLLLPRRDLGALLPDAAWAWLAQAGAVLRLGARVDSLERAPSGAWRLGGDGVPDTPQDAVILATGPRALGRLLATRHPAEAARAEALPQEAIATVMLDARGRRLGRPMLMLPSGPQTPAQVLFDLGQLRDPETEVGAAGCWAAVVSAAGPALREGATALGERVAAQLEAQAGPLLPTAGFRPTVWRVLAERHATFRAEAGLARLPGRLDSGLLLAGDHVEGPYPSTLEGAVRSGLAAAHALTAAPTGQGGL